MAHIAEDTMSLIHQRDFLVKENQQLKEDVENMKQELAELKGEK